MTILKKKPRDKAKEDCHGDQSSSANYNSLLHQARSSLPRQSAMQAFSHSCNYSCARTIPYAWKEPALPPEDESNCGAAARRKFAVANSDDITDSPKHEEDYNSEDEHVPPEAKSAAPKATDVSAGEDGHEGNRQPPPLDSPHTIHVPSTRLPANQWLADQVYGDQEMHDVVRKLAIDYLAKNKDHFSAFVTEDFSQYLSRKGQLNCHGNHVEMQAICEMYNRPIEIYRYCAEPINTFTSAHATDNDPIRLSYHNDCHYNSLINPYRPSVGVGLGLPGLQPGLADRQLINDASKASDNLQIEEAMLKDKIRETDWELTEQSIEEQVARESYLEWLKVEAKCKAGGTAAAPKERSVEQAPPAEAALAGNAVVATATGGASAAAPSAHVQAIADCDWVSADDETDVLALVLRQSQQEYWNSLKKPPSPLPPPAVVMDTDVTAPAAGCSASATGCSAPATGCSAPPDSAAPPLAADAAQLWPASAAPPQ